MPKSKDRSRSELEKLRSMSFKEKLWYIWTYYNYFIIGTVLIVAFIISFISSVSRNSQIELMLVWENPIISEEELDIVGTNLTEKLFDEESRKEVSTVRFFPIGNDNPVAAAQYVERLVTMISARAIDIFILDKSGLDKYAYDTYLLPLDDVVLKIKETDPIVYELIESEFIYATFGNYDEPETNHIAGIRITDSPFLQNMPFQLYDEVYLSISISSDRVDTCISAIIEIFTP